MSVPTPAELLAFLQEHGFLTPPQVQQLRVGSDTKFADARVLARELMDRNWLTPYQANQLLLGRGDDLLVGSYRILDRLGEGGMGQVFKACHVSMDRIVAFKIISKDRVSNPTAVAQLYREVRAVAKLSHPNIVMAFEVNQVGQTPFLAMEYVQGIDLAKLVQQSGPLPIPRACDYICQAATGLQHAHEKGLVHRDIKPGNLIVTRPNPDEPPIVKILDFGLARFESEGDRMTRLTQLGKVVGTVDYIAPEQVENARTADIRADIFSLGCTLFYLLAGSSPFQGHNTFVKIGARVIGNAPSVQESRPEVSPALERVVAKMLARNPMDRYQTPAEVAKALEPHTQDEKQAALAAPTILDWSVAPPPKPPAVEEAPSIATPKHTATIQPAPKSSAGTKTRKQRFTTPKTEVASLPQVSGPEPRRRVTTPVWIALAGAMALGAVALLGILIAVIVFVANKDATDSKNETPIITVEQRRPVGTKPDDKKPNLLPQVLPSKLLVDLGGGVKMAFVLIPKGKFTMGSPKTEKGHEDREEQHEVEITKPFYLAKYPVTQEQYQSLMKENPSHFRAGKGEPSVKGLDTKRFPVEAVSWDDAQTYCKKMRDQDKQRRQFRLPTEAEWEYACRAGTQTAYFFGDDDKDLGEYAWFGGNSEGRTHDVGTRKPNPWGLYDMHGNVFQWCEDDYDGTYYDNSNIKDPLNINKPRLDRRVSRGGSWFVNPMTCRAAKRDGVAPQLRTMHFGFRVCLAME